MATSAPLQYGEVSVGLADSIVLPANPARIALLISNPGPNNVWIAFGQTAVVNSSLLIPANSPPLLFRTADWPSLLNMDVHGITTVAPGKLAGLSLLNQSVS